MIMVFDVGERALVKVLNLFKSCTPGAAARTSGLPSCVFAEGFLVEPIVKPV
jgi:hypothetical protein